MKQLRWIASLAVLTSLYSGSCIAQTPTKLTMPQLFGDHMVLQQRAQAPIWGWAEASTTVQIVGSWNIKDTTRVTVNDYGRWIAKVKTPAQGGPYTLQIIGTQNKIEYKDVMLGEVWLCSGQSNMEFAINNGVENMDKEIAQANNKNLRYFSLTKRGSKYPQDDCSGNWEVCSPEVMKKRSAIAYFFGDKISKDLNVPVGVIVSAWGGTPAEPWVTEEVINNNKDLKASLPDKEYPWWPISTATLYNGMIHPLMPMEMAGVLWYQGESNKEHPSTYSHLMEELISCWRKGFQKQLPFYVVQIAPYIYGLKNDEPARIREAQEDFTERVPDAYMVCTNDVGNPNDIHPRQKREVGDRLANLALNKTYGVITTEVESPRLNGFKTVGNKMVLTFDRAKEGIFCTGKKVSGMTIAGHDNKFVPAQVRIKGNIVEVSAKGIKSPKAVRYCFDEATRGNLCSKLGLPVLPFRTDK